MKTVNNGLLCNLNIVWMYKSVQNIGCSLAVISMVHGSVICNNSVKSNRKILFYSILFYSKTKLTVMIGSIRCKS